MIRLRWRLGLRCRHRRKEAILFINSIRVYDAIHEAVEAALDVAEKAHVLLRNQTTFSSSRVLCDEPALSMAVGDQYDLTLHQWELIVVFPRKVKERHSPTMHFFCRRGNSKLVITGESTCVWQEIARFRHFLVRIVGRSIVFRIGTPGKGSCKVRIPPRRLAAGNLETLAGLTLGSWRICDVLTSGGVAGIIAVVGISVESTAALTVGIERGTSAFLGVAFSPASVVKVDNVGLVFFVASGMADDHRAVDIFVLDVWRTVCKRRLRQLFPSILCSSGPSTSIGVPRDGWRWIGKPPADFTSRCRDVGGLLGEGSVE